MDLHQIQVCQVFCTDLMEKVMMICRFCCAAGAEVYLVV